MKRSSTRMSLVAVSLALGIVMAALSSINLAIPAIALQTNASQTTLTWVVDAYALTFALLLLPGGALGDRFGRRCILILGLMVFGLASLGTVLIEGTPALVTFRAVMGIGSALIMPATLATITATFPPERRSSGVAVWAAVTSISAFLGLVVTGVALEHWSYRATFVPNVALPVVAVVAALVFVPESKQQTRHRIDVVGTVLATLGLAPIVYAIIEAPSHGWASVETLAELAAGLAMLIVFVVWELRTDHPLLDPRVFRDVAFSTGAVSITVQFIVFYGFVFVYLQYAQLVLGYSALVSGLAIGPTAIGVVVGTRVYSALGRRFGPDVFAGTGLLLIAAGLSGLALVPEQTAYIVSGVTMFIAGIGLGLATMPATTAITDGLSLDQQGVASAVNDLAREVGGALGVAVLGSILATSYRSHLTAPTGAALDRARESFSAATAMSPDVARSAHDAFVSATQTGLLVAGGIAGLATLCVVGLIAAKQHRSLQVSSDGPRRERVTESSAGLP